MFHLVWQVKQALVDHSASCLSKALLDRRASALVRMENFSEGRIIS